MFRVEEFKQEHLHGLDSWQEAPEVIYADPETSFTAYIGDEILFCAGVQAYWTGRGEAWAFINRGLATLHSFKIIKTFKRYLQIAPFERIEAAAEIHNEMYNRFLRLVGFRRRGIARKYLPDGGDAILYEMVKA
jgi:RimJ/RimL family protein N-acetyltransferase